MGSEVTTIVIIGATGDLAQRKLLPALFNLRCKRRLPLSVHILGMARAPYDEDGYREHMWNGVRQYGGLAVQHDVWAHFAKQIHYVAGDLTDPSGAERLQERLADIEIGASTANRLYYLSTAPTLFTLAVESLGLAGLAEETSGWRRLVVEKPFGRDQASARALNNAVHKVFEERQVFRIDHYLGKETVQNLVALRFANTIFEPLWNRTYVDNVQITVAENIDVGGRAGYYDQSGVVRDMVQNHLLQLLALVAMEPPTLAGSDALRAKKAEVLQAVRRWSPEEFRQHAVAAQYEGYRGTEGVQRDSHTPTYAAIRLYIDNWRWQGVPFYLRSGKAMATKLSEIVVQFKPPPLAIFPSEDPSGELANALSICVQPDEGAHMRFLVKVPDQGMQTEPVNMEFHYRNAFAGQELPEAYERLLEDALGGDVSLFIRADQTELAWSIVDPLIKCWDDARSGPIQTYARGTWGPDAADRLIAEQGHRWQSLCQHD